MQQQHPMDLQTVRQIIARILGEEAVPQDALQAARAAVESICQEAAEQGLTSADVLQALLRPVFARKQGCDCTTCMARRADIRKGSRAVGHADNVMNRTKRAMS